MSTKKKNLGEMIVRWEALSTTLKQNLTDLPQATQDQADFEALIANVKGLSNNEDSFISQLRQATHDRIAAQKQGRDLRNRLAAQIQGKYGLTSDRLLAFGVQPRKAVIVRRRKKAGSGSGATPAPVTPAASGSHNPPAA